MAIEPANPHSSLSMALLEDQLLSYSLAKDDDDDKRAEAGDARCGSA